MQAATSTPFDGAMVGRCLWNGDARWRAKNPKSETRNPKQARITKTQMSKTTGIRRQGVLF
jgi:hypothetical protein